jgi:hypothetical protein
MSHKHTATLDQTKRAPPSEYSSNSRSRSRSRTRFQRPRHGSDPLLSNLSPTSTLEALSYTDFRPAETRNTSSELHKSVASASSSERALGIRAASAAKKLKEWHAEVSGWVWPGAAEDKNAFEVPNVGDLASGHGAVELGAHRFHESDHHAVPDKEWEYWGSLPRRVVEEYEERIEVIADGMEALDVEELKSHILEAHMPSTSRPASLYHQREGSAETASHNHLDDFTAVVTATILQALPYVARLNMLLHTWSVRCAVLRQVPGFLRAPEDANTAITSGWSTISESGASTPGYGNAISRQAFKVMQPILENRLTAAGRRLDRMLDALEGREDTVPKQWIDDMEILEVDYSNWVVEAEKRVLDNELRHYHKGQHELQHQPTNTKEVAQKQLKPSEHSPVSEDIVTGQSPGNAQQAETFEVHPMQQTLDMPNMSEGDESVPRPSMPNSKQSDRESSILEHIDEQVPDGGENDTFHDGATVLPLKANSTLSGQSSLSEEALSTPASTANDIVSSVNSVDVENPYSIEEQHLSTSAYDLRAHQPEGSGATAARQHQKSEYNNCKHSLELSQQVDFRLPTDHLDNKGPQPVQEVQPGTLTSESLPPESFGATTKVSVQDTLQTDGTSENYKSNARLDDYTNQSFPIASDDHGSEKDLSYRNNRITSPELTIIPEPGDTNRTSSPSEQPHAPNLLEDVPSLLPDEATGIDSDTTIGTATSLPMPGSWDEEGITTEPTQDQAKLTSPSSDNVGPKTLVEPGTETTLPLHGMMSEDGQKHINTVANIVTEKRTGKPAALTLLSHITHADRPTSSDNSQPGSATSDLYSNASTPEIRDARAAQSFGKPVEVTSPIRLSDQRGHDRLSSDKSSPSQQTMRASHDLPRQGILRASTTPVPQRNRSSSFALEPTIHEDPVIRHDEALGHDGGEGDTEMRRASVASIEVLSRKEVSSITALTRRTIFDTRADFK